jgi:hypothetical protein
VFSSAVSPGDRWCNKQRFGKSKSSHIFHWVDIFLTFSSFLLISKINISRCRAFYDMARFNSGSWMIAIIMGGLAYLTVLQEFGWDVTEYPTTKNEIIQHSLFAGPAALLAILAFIVPIILNPYILGWPFLRQKKEWKRPQRATSTRTIKKDALGREIVDIPTFMNAAKELDKEIERAQNKPDVELGSLATKELPNSPITQVTNRKQLDSANLRAHDDEYRRSRQRQENIRTIQEDPAGRRSRESSRNRREQKQGQRDAGRGYLGSSC